MNILGYAIGIVLSYLIGTIIWGYFVGKIGGIDIRRWGSGNVGATNVGRIMGGRRGTFVFVMDVLKGVAAAGLIGRCMGGILGTDPTLFLVFCCVAVILGHIFPWWLGFKGGKGVATALGACLMLEPLGTLIALAVWVVLVTIWKYVSLGSIVAAAVLPFAVYLVNLSHVEDALPQVIFSAGLGVLVIVRHIGNIRRLIAGTESKFGRISAEHVRANRPDDA